MDVEAILALEDESIEKAVFLPNSSKLAKKVFGVIQSSVNSCLVLAGMDGRVIAIDQDKMERMAERRELDLVRYETQVRHFISKYLSQMNKKD